MADDRFEKLLIAWGAEYGAKYRDEPRRWRETDSHPIARAMQFAPGKKVRHATRQIVGRGGYQRRLYMGANAGRFTREGQPIAVPMYVADSVRCKESRSGRGSQGRPIAPELSQVERAVQALEEVNMIRALCVRVQYAGGDSKQEARAQRVNEELRKLSKGHEGIGLNMYREQLGFGRVWLHGRLLELLVAA